MCVWGAAGGHALPVLEPADAPFHRVARRVPCRVVGLGVQTPAPGRQDSLNAPLRQLGAEGVAVVGPIRDQAGQGRADPSLDLNPGLGAVVALVARQAQTQGAAPLIRQAVDLAGCARGRDPAPSDPDRTADCMCRPAGRGPDVPVTPVGIAAIDRSSPAHRGRQLAPRGTYPCHPAQRFHEKTATRLIARVYDGTCIKNECGAH